MSRVHNDADDDTFVTWFIPDGCEIRETNENLNDPGDAAEGTFEVDAEFEVDEYDTDAGWWDRNPAIDEEEVEEVEDMEVEDEFDDEIEEEGRIDDGDNKKDESVSTIDEEELTLDEELAKLKDSLE